MDSILPTFDEYQSIFNYINDLKGNMQDNRLMLCEWLKLSH